MHACANMYVLIIIVAFSQLLDLLSQYYDFVDIVFCSHMAYLYTSIKTPSRVLFLAMYTQRRIRKEQRYDQREEREN